MEAHELNLDSVVFAELRMSLDEEIGRTVRALKEKGLQEGVVSAKIKIGMMAAPDENGEIHYTAIFEPKVSSRIGSSMEDKCGATGGRVTVTDDGTVIMGQIGMDELLKEQEGA